MPRRELVAGHGARVTDAAGRELLDFVSGIAVNAFGHAPRGLAAAVSKQMRTLSHCSNLFANRPAIELAQALVEATGYERVFFCNSGTEAIEAALKFARAATPAGAGRDVVAFRGGFHGRTAWALSTTWNPAYRQPFEPLMPGVRFGHYNQIEGLDELLQGAGTVIVEPVQGEAGAVPGRREFLQAVATSAKAAGAKLVLDEIQSGMGRTGKLLASEHYDLRGDLVVLSKALGAGFPIGAVLMTAEVARALAPGMHGCTFGGNPAAAAAALWSLARIRKPSFLAGVRRRARRLEAGLTALAAKHPSIGEARGLGLLRAVEIAAAAPYGAPDLVRVAAEEGLLLVRGGERAVRLLPPLDVAEADIDEALLRLDRTLARLEGEN